MSPRDFANPGAGVAELGWARALFCDCVVKLSPPRVGNKVCETSADGCHFGYDFRRREHLVWVPSIRHLGTYRVVDWCGEDKFTLVKQLSADTPVNYHQMTDMPVGSATRDMLPSIITTRHAMPAELGPVPVRARAYSLGERFFGDAVNKWCGGDDKLLTWVDGASDVPLAVALAVTPTNSTATVFPTTLKEAMASPHWPLIQ